MKERLTVSNYSDCARTSLVKGNAIGLKPFVGTLQGGSTLSGKVWSTAGSESCAVGSDF